MQPATMAERASLSNGPVTRLLPMVQSSLASPGKVSKTSLGNAFPDDDEQGNRAAEKSPEHDRCEDEAAEQSGYPLQFTIVAYRDC